MLQEESVWARYAEGTAGRRPMDFLDTAIELTDGEEGRGRLAIDLGCGAGNETLALLEKGWRVHAVDGEPKAIEVLMGRVPPDQKSKLTTDVNRFHEAALPEADLVFASLSLPFAGEHLQASVANAVQGLGSGGWFVGVFFGHNDTWADEPDVATLDASAIRAMLAGLDSVNIEESEFDGPSGAGPKHWHWLVATGRQVPWPGDMGS